MLGTHSGSTLGFSFVLAILFGLSKVRTCRMCVHYARTRLTHFPFRSFFPFALLVSFPHITYIGTSHVMQCMHYSLALLSSLPSPPLPPPRLPDVLLAELGECVGGAGDTIPASGCST